jgi:hypothetical protein
VAQRPPVMQLMTDEGVAQLLEKLLRAHSCEKALVCERLVGCGHMGSSDAGHDWGCDGIAPCDLVVPAKLTRGDPEVAMFGASF